MGKFELKVLLVEDDRLSLFVYAEFIKNIVSEVFTATNGKEGIDVFKDKKPHIIITDIKMPEMDGLEMIREIKKTDPNVKVIMISGHSEVEYFIRSIDLGVDGYLLKPVDNTKLKIKINELGENLMLSSKVAEKERAEKVLIKAKEKAEEADQLKGVFLANISHEIQTPIKAIISFSNLLKSDMQDAKRRQELINIIESNSNALLNLTNDILEFTRLQSKTVKLFKIKFELKLFLIELFPVFESQRREQTDHIIKLKIKLPKKPESILISSDPSRLRQVLTNLISNAFKFTHEGHVEYGFEIVKNKIIRFYVRDTGLGISREYQEEIFKRFVQEPKPMTTKKEGTGLGLSITQSLIKMLGGKIWVESEIGKGSTFYFEFPDIIVRSNLDHEEEFQWKEREILVIEDEISDYVSLEDILKGRIKINYVDSPARAVEFCSINQKIDLCLYHWQPGKDLRFIDEIRKMKKGHPVIACLDRGIKGKHGDILKQHFNDTIIKPYREMNVLKVLDTYLS